MKEIKTHPVTLCGFDSANITDYMNRVHGLVDIGVDGAAAGAFETQEL